MVFVFRGVERANAEKLISPALEASHELARVSVSIRQNPAALEVLKQFDLSQLAEYGFGAKWAEKFIAGDPSEVRSTSVSLMRKWNLMVQSVIPWKELTVPKVLSKPDGNASIVSIELQYEGEEPQITILAKAIESLEQLYQAIAAAYQEDTSEILRVVKIDSGSNIKIYCKGIDKVVKHLNDFFLEAWHKFRHKRAEELIENNRALISSVAAIQQVDNLLMKGAIDIEKSERLKYEIVNSTIKLFDSRALPGNIPTREQVDNLKMLDVFSPKLISEGSAPANSAKDANTLVEDVTKKIVKKSVPKQSASRKANGKPIPKKPAPIKKTFIDPDNDENE